MNQHVPAVADVQSYIRRTAALGRETERFGPFLATYSRNSTNPNLSYAVPDADARPTPTEVDALVAGYRTRGRQPRLEFIPEIAPAVEDALLDHGFTVERRIPLMVCSRDEHRRQPAPDGVELLVPGTDVEVAGMISATREAYGELAAPTSGDIAGIRSLLAGGGFAVLARDSATGEALGGGVGTEPSDLTTELAGFGVRPAWRRRGIAAAITDFLTTAAFSAGLQTVFLTPGGPDEERIYARVGFRRLAEMLHISVVESVGPTGDESANPG